VPPHRRPVNLMFQSYALFPHMSVERNVAFGLKMEGMRGDAVRRRVEEMLSLVQLQGLGKRMPHQISGGQRQRVALARALAKQPKVLLLDEPLSALDRKLRAETRLELTRIQRELGITFVLVTHDQEEALSMSNRIAVMNGGRIEQVGTPADIYERPLSRFVAGFVGTVNLLEATVEARRETSARLRVAGHTIEHDDGAQPPPVGQVVCLALRPEDMTIAPVRPGAEPDGAHVAGTLRDTAYLGERLMCSVEVAGGPLVQVSVSRGRSRVDGLALGDAVWLGWHPGAGRLLTR
jgi:putrescine transport system ATP-binding protein